MFAQQMFTHFVPDGDISVFSFISFGVIAILAGVAYSIDGQLKNVANNTYIITPCNVDVADTQVRVAEAQQNFATQTANTNADLTSDSLF